MPSNQRGISVQAVRKISEQFESDEFSPSPADELEAKERKPDQSFDNVSLGFARILQWLVDGGDPRCIGQRALVMVYKLRPDLLHGVSLRALGRYCGNSKDAVHKLTKDFESIFQIQGIYARTAATRAKIRQAALRRHPNAISQTDIGTHVSVVNHFKRWHNQHRKTVKSRGLTRDHARTILEDLRPIAAFISEISGAV